ncbi:hypothetical protein E2I00_014877, partial [Balaenoptera physalus]
MQAGSSPTQAGHAIPKRTVTVSSSLSESIVPSHRLVALFVSTLSLTIKATTSCTSCSLIDMSLNIPMLPVANKDDLLWNHLPSSEDIVQVSSDLDSKLSAREYKLCQEEDHRHIQLGDRVNHSAQVVRAEPHAIPLHWCRGLRLVYYPPPPTPPLLFCTLARGSAPCLPSVKMAENMDNNCHICDIDHGQIIILDPLVSKVSLEALLENFTTSVALVRNTEKHKPNLK